MMGIRRSPLNRFLIAIMPIGIPALVITIQLSVWAVLVHYGYGEVSWKRWLIDTLVCAVALFLTGLAFFDEGKNGFKITAFTVLYPWVACAGLIIGKSVVFFNFSFLTLEWFLFPSGLAVVSLYFTVFMKLFGNVFFGR